MLFIRAKEVFEEELLSQQQQYDTTSSSWSNSSNTIHRTLGILIMIVDDFPNESFWKIWLDNIEQQQAEQQAGGEKYKVRLWFHAKHPHRLQSEFVRSRLVQSFQLSPDWGSVDLTKTMVLMLREAMKEEPDIEKFVFASESCLPIRSLPEVIHTVYSGKTLSNPPSLPLLSVINE